MFTNKNTIARLAGGIAVAASLVALSASAALGRANPSGGHDPWYRNAVSLTRQQASVPFITDTLSPGGSAPVQGYRLITDTLSPGGGSSLAAALTSPGFNWGDAGIGAGSAGALLVLLGGMLLVTG